MMGGMLYVTAFGAGMYSLDALLGWWKALQLNHTVPPLNFVTIGLTARVHGAERLRNRAALASAACWRLSSNSLVWRLIRDAGSGPHRMTATAQASGA